MITDTYTLPPWNRLKLYWNQSFGQNKHTICGHLVTPYILVIKNVDTPYFLSKNFVTPQPSIFGTPHSEENDSPLSGGIDWLVSLYTGYRDWHHVIDTMVHFAKSHFGQHSSSPKQWKIYFSTQYLLGRITFPTTEGDIYYPKTEA